jgi:RES domain-containing protein
VILWRISNFANLEGLGGYRLAGRWHNPGAPIVYLAEHPALALIEVLVHFDISTMDDLPDLFQLIEVEVDDPVTIESAAPPADWRENVRSTRKLGDVWLREQRSVLLSVPSAVIPVCRNYLLNPLHTDTAKVRIKSLLKLPFDPRLFRP